MQTPIRLLLGASLLVPALAGASLARGPSAEQEALAMDFAMHDAEFTLYHEIGHLLVNELKLPVLGKEEDAADTLATLILLNEASDRAEAAKTLIDTTDGWYFNAVQNASLALEDLSYYDDHSLDIQRAYAMVCLMVGADPETFEETADTYGVDHGQREDCKETYEEAKAAWEQVLEPHKLGKTRGAKVEIVYEPAGDYKEFAAELKKRRILEKAAKLIESNYALPRPVTFYATLCDQPNAFFVPEDGEILYCYELASHMRQLYIDNVEDEQVEASTGSTDEDVPTRIRSTASKTVDAFGSLSGNKRY